MTLRDLIAQEVGLTESQPSKASYRITDKILAHIAANTAARQGWKPISSAPKDGSWVLTWGAEEGFGLGRFPEFLTDPYDAWGDATHWMPLPDPPVRQSRDLGPSVGTMR